MEYISQAVLLAIALIGAFFKCVEEDAQGRTAFMKRGLPRPTTAGAVVAALLIVSFLVSIFTTRRENANQATLTRESRDELAKVSGLLKEVERKITLNRSPSLQADTGWIAVTNAFRSEVSFWLYGEQWDLQQQESTSLRVNGAGSELWLYSCGWEAAQTSPGQGTGCRFISYPVLPGQSWEVVETPPAPRIVMSLRP